MAFPTGWNRKQKITLQSSKVSANLTDFPFLITLDHLNAEIADGGVNSALNGGGDIRFSADSAGTVQLACEVVSFVAGGTPKAEIWVKIPSLSATVNTDIYIWYKNAGQTQPLVTNPYGRNAVWSDYLLVAHDCLTDSTGAHTLANVGTMAAVGPNGTAARLFDGVNDEITDNLNADQRPVTVQLWFNPADLSLEHTLWSYEKDGWGQGAYLGTTSAGDLKNEEWKSGGAWGSKVTATVKPALNTWSRASMSYVGDSSRTIYLNGGNSATNSGTKAGAFDAVNSSGLGKGGYSSAAISGWFDGVMFGYRVYNGTLSAARISTEYNNQNDPATFAVAGAPEAVGGGLSLAINNSISDTNSDNVILLLTPILSLHDSRHNQTVDNIIMGQGQSLQVSGGWHDLVNTLPLLTRYYSLTISPAVHGHSAENPVLSQGNSLLVTDSGLTVSSDNMLLAQMLTLLIQKVTHGLRDEGADIFNDSAFMPNPGRIFAASPSFRTGKAASQNSPHKPTNHRILRI